MTCLDKIKFDENGLIPAVVTDFYTKKVLTLAYMNRQSLEISIKEGTTCFYSRSRKALWRKGETSGNVQRIVSITADCDLDALWVEVVKDGPACHLGTDGCFNAQIYQSETLLPFSMHGLYDLLADRKQNKKEGSYTSYLFKSGLDKILKKVGEECTEVIVAGKGGDKRETVYEIADLIYHLTVLAVQADISLDEIIDELKNRRVIEKKVKQQKMK